MGNEFIPDSPVIAYRPTESLTWDGGHTEGCEARWYASAEEAAHSLGFRPEQVERALATDGKLYIWRVCAA